VNHLFPPFRFRVQVVLATLLALCAAQDYEDYQPSSRQQHSPAAARYATEAPKEEPIAILKQINKHNEDGSYTYGYEGADGSFKIETKAANGEVKGKYGYVDGEGKQRVVEYGANKYGFQPSGEGITVSSSNSSPPEEIISSIYRISRLPR
jgi:Insect cuticle protein